MDFRFVSERAAGLSYGLRAVVFEISKCGSRTDTNLAVCSSVEGAQQDSGYCPGEVVVASASFGLPHCA